MDQGLKEPPTPHMEVQPLPEEKQENGSTVETPLKISPLWLPFMIAAFIFLGEALIMGTFTLFPDLSAPYKVILDSLFLVALLSPALYFFMFLPLNRQLEKIGHTKDELAVQVEKRTKDLKEINDSLNAQIDEYEQIKDHLLKSQEKVTALLQGSRSVLKYRNFTDAARSIFDACKDLIGATGGYVALMTESGTENDVLFLDAGGRKCTVDPSLPMPIRGLRAEAYRTCEAVYDNAFHESKWMDFIPAGHVKIDNVLFAPLVIEGKALGLIGLANKPGGYNPGDAEIALAFGEMAAIALQNSRMMDLLERSEKRFRSVAQTAIEGIITIDTGGNITFWNQGAEKIFGYATAEMIDKPLYTIIPERYRQAHAQGMERVLAGKPANIIGKTVEVQGIAKDGREIPIELSLAKWNIKGEIFFTGIVHDITGRKRIENALRDSHEKLEVRVEQRTEELARAVGELKGEITERKKVSEERSRLATAIEQAVETVVITDPNGTIQYVNPAFEQVTGYAQSEAVGKNPRILKSGKHDDAFYKELWETITSGKTWTGTLINKKKDGTLYEENTTISPIFDDDRNIVSFAAVKKDVTYENMLHKARDYFTTVTSHELTIPLTKLQLAKTMMDMSDDLKKEPDKMDKIVSMLDESYDGFSRILSTTTLLSDLNMPQSKQHFASVYPYMEITSCIEEARVGMKNENRSIDLTLDIDRLPRDARVTGKPTMIFEAMSNILSNAIKSTPDGKKIDVRAWTEGRRVIIECRDEGIGIPRENIQDVFEPYFSLENILHHSSGRYKYRGGGIGLGITIGKMIAEYHNGSLTLHSDGENRGATVTLSLPLAG